MSTGLVCLRCRAYLGACSCPRPQPSEDAKTPLPGTEDGVNPDQAAQLVRFEHDRERERRAAGTSRAERRRQERAFAKTLRAR